MFNRRDLLKMLGAGATIVPVIGGVPEAAAQARLIAEPQIEPVTLATQSELEAMHAMNLSKRDLGKKVFITVDIVGDDGHYRFQADSFLVGWESELVDVTTHDSPFRQHIIGRSKFEWTIRGVATGQPNHERL